MLIAQDKTFIAFFTSMPPCVEFLEKHTCNWILDKCNESLTTQFDQGNIPVKWSNLYHKDSDSFSSSKIKSCGSGKWKWKMVFDIKFPRTADKWKCNFIQWTSFLCTCELQRVYV